MLFTMAKKYDTNPLDPDFPEKVKAQTASVGQFTSPVNQYKTAEFPAAPPSITEDETRRFGEAEFQAYSFAGQPPMATAAQPLNVNDTEKTVESIGVREKWLLGLPYIPFTIGLIAGIILLLVIKKDEPRIRFHAAQGLAAHLGILFITTILGFIGNIASPADLANFIFNVVTTVMLVVFAIKAWTGKPVHIDSVDDLTNWLEDKIGPVR